MHCGSLGMEMEKCKLAYFIKFYILSYLLAALCYAVGGRHIDVINKLKRILRNIR